jgi:probable F420-dependent oxidoreductase
MDPRLALRDVAAYTARVEALGFDGLHVAETVHDSLAVALLAVEHSTRLTIRTAVTLAFVRSPTLVAYTAWDLSRVSGGRFELGLGTQIRQNVEDRFGLPWTEPVSRMREYVEALGALYGAFRSGEAPRFEGNTYRITRMQPYFNPGPDEETAVPPTWLGGVNRGMCELAGERTAGLVAHPTNSLPGYLADVVRPSIEAGAAKAGRSLGEIGLVAAATVVAGAGRDEVAAELERQRRLFAFLYSTPAYAPTLERLGRAELPARLRAVVRDGDWDRLPALVTDELLGTVAAVGRWDEVGEVLVERFGTLVDGVSLPPLGDPGADGHVAGLVSRLQAA